jgi:hypothetical protein
MKNLVLFSVMALFSVSAFAKDTNRKVASVDLSNEKAVKKMALELSKTYVGKPTYGKITSWKAESVKKEGANTVVAVMYYTKGGEDEQGECSVTVTFSPADDQDGKRMGGAVLVEAGMCIS